MDPTMRYPLIFKPIYQDYVWGGTRIREHFARPIPLERCAESWEIADRPEGQSVVDNGPLAGTPLKALIHTRTRELMGPAFTGDTFPLLVKVLDARELLSLQVHPDDDAAARHGGEAKTEMWCLLAVDADAFVYAGLRPGVDAASLGAALRAGNPDTLLQRLPVRAGDAVYMPGGQVHAVGPGCLILEIQQNSNTTYRLHDWGRLGADGRPRALHLDEALRVIRWSGLPAPLATPTPLPAPAGATRTRLVACPHFETEVWTLTQPVTPPPEPDTCRLCFVATGEVRIRAAAGETRLPAGTTALLPACALEGMELVPLNHAPAQIYLIAPGPAVLKGRPTTRADAS